MHNVVRYSLFAGRSEQLVAEVRDDGRAALDRAIRGKTHLLGRASM